MMTFFYDETIFKTKNVFFLVILQKIIPPAVKLYVNIIHLIPLVPRVGADKVYAPTIWVSTKRRYFNIAHLR
jgi:hypothetical protein